MRRTAMALAALAAGLVLPPSALASQALTITKAGPGTGTVTSSPAGIACGPTCSANFADGTAVTLSAAPGPNTGPVAQWSGCDTVTGEGKCEVTMSAARAVKVTFQLVQRQLNVSTAGPGTGTVTSSPAGIECGATCTASYTHGTIVTLSGAPGPNTDAVVQWSGCGVVDAEGRCVVTMSAAKSVIATFNLAKRRLTVVKNGAGTGTVTSTPSGISCGPACEAGFPLGSSVTLIGTRGFHSQAVKWSSCDTVTAENKCLVTMSSAREVTATFALEPQYVEFTLTLNPKGTGTGSVVSFPPGISCPGDCSQKFIFKTPITLIATADGGSAFSHWSGGTCSGTGPCERKINSDRTVNAVFKAVGNRTLTIAKAGSGSGVVTSKPAAIECGQACSTELDAATKVALHAVPTPGSTFTGWSGEGCAGTGPCKVLMNEARNVTATFTKNPTPPEVKCRVPRLKGKTLAKARRALSAAHCTLGRVKKPKGKGGKLVVRSSSPGVGTTLAAGSRVNVKLMRKR